MSLQEKEPVGLLSIPCPYNAKTNVKGENSIIWKATKVSLRLDLLCKLALEYLASLSQSSAALTWNKTILGGLFYSSAAKSLKHVTCHFGRVFKVTHCAKCNFDWSQLNLFLMHSKHCTLILSIVLLR